MKTNATIRFALFGLVTSGVAAAAEPEANDPRLNAPSRARSSAAPHVAVTVSAEQQKKPADKTDAKKPSPSQWGFHYRFDVLAFAGSSTTGHVATGMLVLPIGAGFAWTPARTSAGTSEWHDATTGPTIALGFRAHAFGVDLLGFGPRNTTHGRCESNHTLCPLVLGALGASADVVFKAVSENGAVTDHVLVGIGLLGVMTARASYLLPAAGVDFHVAYTPPGL